MSGHFEDQFDSAGNGEEDPFGFNDNAQRSLVSEFEADLYAPSLDPDETELDHLDTVTERTLLEAPTEGDDAKLYVGELMFSAQMEILSDKFMKPPAEADYVFVRVPACVNDLYLKQSHWDIGPGGVVNGIVSKTDIRPWPLTLLKDLELRARKEQGKENADTRVIFWLPLRLEFQVHYCSLVWESCAPSTVFASDSQEEYWNSIPSLGDLDQVRRSLYCIMTLHDTDCEDVAAVSIHRAVRRIWSSSSAMPKIEEFKGHRMPHDESCGWCCLSDGRYFARTGNIGDIPIQTLNNQKQTIPLSEVYLPALKPKGGLEGKPCPLKIALIPPKPPVPLPLPVSSVAPNKTGSSGTISTTRCNPAKTYVPSGNVRQKVLLPEDCEPLSSGLRCLTKGSARVLIGEMNECFDAMSDIDPDRITVTRILIKKKLEEVASLMRSL